MPSRHITYDLPDLNDDEDAPATSGEKFRNADDQDDLPETQFQPTSGDSELLWEAKGILDEWVPSPSDHSATHEKAKRSNIPSTAGPGQGFYLVDWDGIDSSTGQPYAPTWEPKTGCTDLLIKEWKEAKAANSRLVGRYRREHPEVGLPPGVKADVKVKVEKRKTGKRKKVNREDEDRSDKHGRKTATSVKSDQTKKDKGKAREEIRSKDESRSTYASGPASKKRKRTSESSESGTESSSSHSHHPSAPNYVIDLDGPGSGGGDETYSPYRASKRARPIPARTSRRRESTQSPAKPVPRGRMVDRSESRPRSRSASVSIQSISHQPIRAGPDEDENDNEDAQEDGDTSRQLGVVPSSDPDEDEIAYRPKNGIRKAPSGMGGDGHANVNGTVKGGENGKGKDKAKLRAERRVGQLDLTSIATPESTAESSFGGRQPDSTENATPGSSRAGATERPVSLEPGKGRMVPDLLQDILRDSDTDQENPEEEGVRVLETIVRKGPDRRKRGRILDEDPETGSRTGSDPVLDQGDGPDFENEPIDLDERNSDSQDVIPVRKSNGTGKGKARERILDVSDEEDTACKPRSRGSVKPSSKDRSKDSPRTKKLEVFVEVRSRRRDERGVPQQVNDNDGWRRTSSPEKSVEPQALTGLLIETENAVGNAPFFQADQAGIDLARHDVKINRVNDLSGGEAMDVVEETLSADLPSVAVKEPHQTEVKPVRTFAKRRKLVVSKSQATAQEQAIALLMDHWVGDFRELEGLSPLRETQQTASTMEDDQATAQRMSDVPVQEGRIAIVMPEPGDALPTSEAPVAQFGNRIGTMGTPDVSMRDMEVPATVTPDQLDEIVPAAAASALPDMQDMQAVATDAPTPAEKPSKVMQPVPLLSPSAFRTLGATGDTAHRLAAFSMPTTFADIFASQAESIGQFDSPEKAKLVRDAGPATQETEQTELLALPQHAEPSTAMDIESDTQIPGQALDPDEIPQVGPSVKAVAAAQPVSPPIVTEASQEPLTTEAVVQAILDGSLLQTALEDDASLVIQADLAEKAMAAEQQRIIANLEAANADLVSRFGSVSQDLQRVADEAAASTAELSGRLETAFEDLNFTRDLYDKASNQAMTHAERARGLEKQVTLLQSQLSTGLQQQRFVYAADAKARGDEIIILKGQLHLLREQSRLVDDIIREKAVKYPSLLSELEGLEREYELEKADREVAEERCRTLEETLARRLRRADSSRNASRQTRSRHKLTPAIDGNAVRDTLGSPARSLPLQAPTSEPGTLLVPGGLPEDSIGASAASSLAASNDDSYMEGSGSDDGLHIPAGTLPADFMAFQQLGTELTQEFSTQVTTKVEPNEIVPGQADPQILVCKWVVTGQGFCGRVNLTKEDMERHARVHVDEQETEARA